MYHGKGHPADMGAAEVESFLTYLATQRHVKTSCSSCLRGGNFFACITSDSSKFFIVLFNAIDFMAKAQRWPAIKIFELVACSDGFETSPRKVSKYGLSGSPANRYGSYRS
ncbi:MAG: hypothetical protein WC856_15525 [Methylococcaceae bacterium]